MILRKPIYKELSVFLLQLAAWAVLILFSPLIVYFMGGKSGDSWIILYILSCVLLPCMVVYFLNYYLLVPRLFFRNRKIWYFITNMVLVLCANIHIGYGLFGLGPTLPEGSWLGLTAAATITLVLDCGAIGVALAIKSYLRTRMIREQLTEEKHRHAEAELLWLRNQLNPHFLFNALNNINSLVYLDSEKTQDSICRLSDLLRYALYESDKPSVPLSKEVEFMKNYIALMSLRCNDKTKVFVQFDDCGGNVEVAPLLLVTLIENAFKHGVSTSTPSFVSFRMKVADGVVSFVSENTDHHKPLSDRSGSGIGIANMRKRLDLIYHDRYSCKWSSDGKIFRIEIQIDLNNKDK